MPLRIFFSRVWLVEVWITTQSAINSWSVIMSCQAQCLFSSNLISNKWRSQTCPNWLNWSYSTCVCCCSLSTMSAVHRLENLYLLNLHSRSFPFFFKLRDCCTTWASRQREVLFSLRSAVCVYRNIVDRCFFLWKEERLYLLVLHVLLF